MGGSAVLVHGELDAERWEVPRGLFSRLLGRPSVRELAMGDRTLVEFGPGGLDGLSRGFRDFLGEALSPPWPASNAVLDYLDMKVTTVHLRGERQGDAPLQTYVQLGFSGCAGMAQVSADLAAHWAARWLVSERGRIDTQWLLPRGFRAVRHEVVAESTQFVPVGAAGYAAWSPMPAVPGDDTPSTPFVVDDAIEETDADATQLLLSMLGERFGDAMVAGRCHCQLCDPGFDLARLQGLPAFD